MGETVTYLKKFQIAIFIVILSVAAVAFLVMQIIPEFQKIQDIQQKCDSQKKTLTEAESELSDLNESVKKEKAEDEQIVKAFFKPTNQNVDTETAISEEFNEILQILRENKIKTRTLRFEPDPADDNFVKHANDKYFVSRMDAEMIATYSDFEGFLRDLYKHVHFIDISKIKIVPYQKNKRILIIDIQIKLYAQKGKGENKYNVSKSEPENDSNNNQQVQVSSQKRQQNVQPNQTNNSNDISGGDEMTRKHKVYEDKVKE